MEWKEFTAKTVEDALINASVEFGVSSDKVECQVVERESSRFLGLISKPAVIRARIKLSYEDSAAEFLKKVFDSMHMEVNIEASYDEEEKLVSIDLSGKEMGILIGKRGNTLDSLQYLVSLVVNSNSDVYVKVKLDTENYRKRRKETLENLARNLAQKVKKNHKPLFLEPMNPYERRIIHSALQKDKFVETHSEGEEPYRKVVITLKPGVDTGYEGRGKYSKKNNKNGNIYRRPNRKRNHYNYNYNTDIEKYGNMVNADIEENMSEEE